VRASRGRGGRPREPVPLHIKIARESMSAVVSSCLAALAVACGGLLAAHALAGIELAGPLPALAAACLVCLLTLLLSSHRIMRYSRRLATPLEHLAQGVSRIARGDFDARIDDSCAELGIAEVDELVGSFNRMAAALSGMDYMRRDFTSSVSHEFKTPIAAIAGMCELVRDPKLPEAERDEYLGLIREQALRLSTLCESVLAMSRLDAQEIVTRHELTDVDEQIRRDAIMLAERWSARDVAFDLDLDGLPIETDPDLTHQIWINLLDNAYKYTPDGGSIHVESRTLPDGVEVCVRDTGRGMAPDEAAHAFDRFYQADRSRSQGGSGLGLSIVRRICDLLGGSVACRSAPGEGAAMTVRLPRTSV
jgi:signal transduction histidine kinase